MMGQKAERIAYPLTFLLRREGGQWSSLACEVDVASCGETLEEAREGLKEAVGLYISAMLEEGKRDSIARPVPQDALREFMAEGDEAPRIEYYTLIVVPVPDMEMEFVPSELAPAGSSLAAAH